LWHACLTLYLLEPTNYVGEVNTLRNKKSTAELEHWLLLFVLIHGITIMLLTSLSCFVLWNRANNTGPCLLFLAEGTWEVLPAEAGIEAAV
jgi:hypothetical protein